VEVAVDSAIRAVYGDITCDVLSTRVRAASNALDSSSLRGTSRADIVATNA
jgi:hypothetical protein